MTSSISRPIAPLRERVWHIAPARIPVWVQRNLTAHPCESYAGDAPAGSFASPSYSSSESPSSGLLGAEASLAGGAGTDGAPGRAQPVNP